MKHVSQQPSHKDSKPVSKGILDRISHPITILCTVVVALSTVFAILFSQQQQIWEGRLKKVADDLAASQQEVAKLKAAPESTPASDSQQAPTNEFEVSAVKDQTVGGGELRITPTALTLRSDPPPSRYVVTAKVQYKKLPEMQIRDAEEGAIIKYPKNHGYSIRIVKVNSNSASFAISKNP